MAKVKSSGLRNYVGRLGGSVYYMLNGQNIAREKAAEVSNPRTAPQMRQRMQWANIVAMYKVLAPYIGKKSFQNKRPTWSDYNAFMSANLGQEPVYMTKEMVQNNHAILAPYKVTEGSLPAVSVEFNAEMETFETALNLGDFILTPETTISQLATAIIANNTGWKSGDQLGLIVMQNGRLYRPYVHAFEIILDTTDESILTEKMGLEEMLIDTNTGHLIVNYGTLPDPTQGQAVACAVIQSRTIAGKTSVSSQSLVLNADALATYNSLRTEEAFNEARESYGIPTEVWLDAGYQGESGSLPAWQMILSFTGTYQPDEQGQSTAFTIRENNTNNLRASAQDAVDNSTHVVLRMATPLEAGVEYMLAFIPEGSSTPTGTSYAEESDGTRILALRISRTAATNMERRAGQYVLLNSDEYAPEYVIATMNVTAG